MAMTMAMDIDPKLELDLSGYSTTTTTSSDGGDYGCSWSEWSPVVDWGAFGLSGGMDDFQEIIDSMHDESNGAYHNHTNNTNYYSTCHSETTNNAAIAEEVVEINHDSGDVDDADEDQKGLRLVHLLMAAAEALTGVDKSHELARVILVRLKELVSTNNGSNMERLAAYFTDALQGLLEGTHGHGKQHAASTSGGGSGSNRLNGDDYHNQMDALAAFQLMQDMSPYVKFGHFTANQAILETLMDSRRVHIVDYDIMEGIQWPPLMQALVSRKEGIPLVPHLRITALSRSCGGGGGRTRSIGTVQETGRRLVAFAASIGLPFSFHQCRLDSDEKFHPSNLKMVRGETLVFNCMLHLPHFCCRGSNSVASFLSGAKSLSPRLVTLVEEEVGPIGDGGFVGRFMDSLHHYSAMYDSLEAGFPLQCRARALVERVFMGPRIAGSLAGIYRSRDEEVGVGCSWGERLVAMGFKQVGISFANHCQARLLLGLFNDGYRLEELANNKLVLGWKSRRLLSASIWTSSLHRSD